MHYPFSPNKFDFYFPSFQEVPYLTYRKSVWALLILPTLNKLLNNQTQIFCPPPLSLYIQEYQCTNPPPKKNCEGESKKISKFKQGLRLTISFRSQQFIYFFCLESNSVQQGGQWMYWHYNIRIMVGVKPYFDMFEWKGVRNLSTLTQQFNSNPFSYKC